MPHIHWRSLLVILSSELPPVRQLKYYQKRLLKSWAMPKVRHCRVCALGDSEKLFMHSYYFLKLISKYMKCIVTIYFLTLSADCFLLCRGKNKDHQSSSTPLPHVHLFSCLRVFLRLASDLRNIQLLLFFFFFTLVRLISHFLHIMWREMICFFVQIVLGM